MNLRPTLLALTFLSARLVSADTIYQTTAQGKEVVVQRDAILVKEDSSWVVYKHFDLKERRVVKVRLSKGSLPYSVDTSGKEDRERIVDTWRRFGFKAVITDQAGKTTTVCDAYLDFYPPGGHGSLLESLPPRTAFPIQSERGVDEVEFSDIARIEFQGDRLKLTLRKGQVNEGRFLMPTEHPAEARLLGITDHYEPADEDVFDFAMPLGKLKEIRFEGP